MAGISCQSPRSPLSASMQWRVDGSKPSANPARGVPTLISHHHLNAMGCPRLSRERPKSYAIRFGIAMFLYLQVLMLALSCLVMLSSVGFVQVISLQHMLGAVLRKKIQSKWV